MRIQTTLGVVTTGFPAKERLRNERKNYILMTYVTTQVSVVLLIG